MVRCYQFQLPRRYKINYPCFYVTSDRKVTRKGTDLLGAEIE